MKIVPLLKKGSWNDLLWWSRTLDEKDDEYKTRYLFGVVVTTCVKYPGMTLIKFFLGPIALIIGTQRKGIE